MKIEIEKEDDGRWIAEIPVLPRVLAYGDIRKQAIAKAEALALRVMADRLEHEEEIPELKELLQFLHEPPAINQPPQGPRRSSAYWLGN